MTYGCFLAALGPSRILPHERRQVCSDGLWNPVHLDGRGGPILVGRVDGDGKLRVGDQLKFGTKGGDAVVRDGTVVQISNRDKQSWKSPWDDPNWRPGL
jgi:hypothetical protein